MFRYAVYVPKLRGYVGHKTSAYNYSREIPEHMITRNLPLVSPEDSRLYLRESDAKRLAETVSSQTNLKTKVVVFECKLVPGS